MGADVVTSSDPPPTAFDLSPLHYRNRKRSQYRAESQFSFALSIIAKGMLKCEPVGPLYTGSHFIFALATSIAL